MNGHVICKAIWNVAWHPHDPPKPLKAVHHQLKALLRGEQPVCQAATGGERNMKFPECRPSVTGKFVGMVLFICQTEYCDEDSGSETSDTCLLVHRNISNQKLQDSKSMN
jgi:hypothetical protein